MRQRFEQQMNLRIVAISDVKFPLKSRDELPPVLMALQYIFVTPELNKKVFELLEKKVCSDKKKTGRKGMDLWHILVLAVVRHALGTNWDRLEYLANYDLLLRSVMGVHASAFIEEAKIEFNYQTILDNVSLIDEDLLWQINLLVIEAGHKLVKKKEDESISQLFKGQPEVSVFDHYISLLEALAPNPALAKWVEEQAKTFPHLLATLIENKNQHKPVVKKETWSNLLSLERKLPQSQAWVIEMANLVTTCRQRNYINNVLVAEIMTLRQKTPLSGTVLKICREDLQQRVNNKPQPPANWTRSLPATKSNAKQWAILADFLQSPDENIFDFRRNQHERSELEHTINNVTIDLKMETIRKGSPHTLRITKTQASYQRQMKHWNEDVLLLEKVKGK